MLRQQFGLTFIHRKLTKDASTDHPEIYEAQRWKCTTARSQRTEETKLERELHLRRWERKRVWLKIKWKLSKTKMTLQDLWITGRVERVWQSGKSLAECNHHMLTSEDSFDVSFRVGQTEKIVRAHRYVLISRSCVFHPMLCGSLAEKDDIKIPDVEEDIFTELLKYMYTNNSNLIPENVTGLLYLSKKYAVGGLERLCLSFLDKWLSPNNACLILEQAHMFDEKDLYDKALDVILKNGNKCLVTTDFKSLCGTCFHKIVRSESLQVTPGIMFSAALSWAELESERQGREVIPENERLVLGESVYSISFTAMDSKDFARDVVPTNILSSDESTRLLCFFSLPGTDVSPFMVRSAQKREPPKRYTATLQNWLRVSLYDSQIFMNEASQYQESSTQILIESNRNVNLIGFVLFGCITETDPVYEVKIERTGQPHLFRNLLTETITGQSMSSELCDVKILLPLAYTLVKSTANKVYVKLLSQGITLYCGQNLRSSVKAGRNIISLSTSAWKGHGYSDVQHNVGLISQLILEEV